MRVCVSSSFDAQDLALLVKGLRGRPLARVASEPPAPVSEGCTVLESVRRHHYGIAGPRGFYGNLTFYRDLEARVAQRLDRRFGALCPRAWNGIVCTLLQLLEAHGWRRHGGVPVPCHSDFPYVDELKAAARSIGSRVTFDASGDAALVFTNQLIPGVATCAGVPWSDAGVAPATTYALGRLPRWGSYVASDARMGILYNRNTTYSAALPHYMWLDLYGQAS